MLMAFIYEPFIYLITEAQGVVFDAEICNRLQLAPTEYLGVEESFRILICHFGTKCKMSPYFSNRVIRSVDDDGLGLGVEFTSKFFLVQNPVSTIYTGCCG